MGSDALRCHCTNSYDPYLGLYRTNFFYMQGPKMYCTCDVFPMANQVCVCIRNVFTYTIYIYPTIYLYIPYLYYSHFSQVHPQYKSCLTSSHVSLTLSLVRQTEFRLEQLVNILGVYGENSLSIWKYFTHTCIHKNTQRTIDNTLPLTYTSNGVIIMSRRMCGQ